MNKKTTIAFSALALSLVLASCNTKKPGPGGNDPVDTTVEIKPVAIPEGFSDKDLPETVKHFNSTYGTDITTLAAFKTNHQPNSMHIANFIDGLVENDNYGRLVPALAKEVPTPVVNEDTGETTYTFELKDGLVWSKWSDDGKTLVKAADVTAEDFVTAAKQVLDPANVAGGTSYLYHMFIKNSAEYTALLTPDKDGKPSATPQEAEEFFNKNVGVKALDKTHVQYTLPKPMDYFPTVLTYSCYYPVPTELFNKVTDKFGTVDGTKTRENYWYCGAFALKDLVVNNSIDYVKNPLYWDKDSVSLDTIHFMKAPQEADMSWGRTQFERGYVDAFTVKELDAAGWADYVTGPDNKGNAGDPVHQYANAVQATPESTTFYLGYNFNRKLRKNTDLKDSDIDNFEKAIANANFRKAILYATNKSLYNQRNNPSNPTSWNANTYTVPTLAVDDNGRDYVDYIADEFAVRNDMTTEEAKNVIGNGKKGVYNPEAAKHYLNLAIAELGDSVTLPVHFEIIEQQNESQSPFYNAFQKSLQENLDPEEKYIKVSTKQCSSVEMDNAFYNHDYSVAAYFGWGPDYGDPLSFLNTFIVGGDLTPNMGIYGDERLEQKILGTYTNLVEYADSLSDKQEKLKAFAKAEYYLLFDQALIVPMIQRFQGVSVSVTKIKPKTAQLAPYGQGRDKLKDTVVYKEKLNKVQFAYIVKQYEDNKKNISK